MVQLTLVWCDRDRLAGTTARSYGTFLPTPGNQPITIRNPRFSVLLQHGVNGSTLVLLCSMVTEDMSARSIKS